MAKSVTISVDAMGGDHAPDTVLQGVAQALEQDSNLHIILCGDASVVEEFAHMHDRCEACVTTETIAMNEHPARAVRKKKDSSIVVGCRLVRDQEADGFYSAGSTGACLAAATLVTGRIAGVSRPALCAMIPSPIAPTMLCDVGANADCKPEYLLQFAQMATIYARLVLDIEKPSVGLLNIGSEETKGSLTAQEAYKLLSDNLPSFKGNAEGGDVLNGSFDVVVSDGFTGNICLKTIEGTARVVFKAQKKIFFKNLATKLAAGILKPELMRLADSISPDTYGGAPLLGVKGACIVGHGSSNARAVKNGILMTAKIARTNVVGHIEQTLEATLQA